MNMKRFLIVGSGFSGSVLARELVETLDCSVEVWESRDHLGGNCHTFRDVETGVMVHAYGPHIFNTSSDLVWDYVRKYGEFMPYISRVKAVTARGIYSFPINLHTINQFFNKSFDPRGAEQFVSSLGDRSIASPRNFEEAALKHLGQELYENFFKGYTIKQWGTLPTELPASVFGRLPIRFNYNDNYYNSKYQAIPKYGYSSIIEAILTHPKISLSLGRSFRAEDRAGVLDNYDYVFYTGPLDSFFGYSLGRLGYRSLDFERVHSEYDDYQGNAVINYPDLSVPWTRIHEHKHFAPWEKTSGTVVYREYSKETRDGDEPFYPKRLSSDKALLDGYKGLAMELSNSKTFRAGFGFLGRLGTYRYLDMAPTIEEALKFADQFSTSYKRGLMPPPFLDGI